MNFLHPLAILIGGVALAAPLAVHFLTKPRPTPLPLSTIAFVFEAIQQRRSRSRLRDLLVLMLRMLVIAMIALAIARPIMQAGVVVHPGDSDVKVARVVMVDISQSMSAGRGGDQPLQRSISVAEKYLASSDELAAGVVFVAARPQPVFDQLSANLPALRQSVRAAAAVGQSADVMAGLNSAAALLAKTDESMKRELVIISDFQRSDWGAVRFDALPADTTIQLESVALRSPDNLAVLAVRAPQRVIMGEEFRCEAELGNFGLIERPVRCRLKLGSYNTTIETTLSPGESTVSFPVIFDDAGWYSGSIQLIGNDDDLPADDLRPIALKVSPPPQVVLLSGQNAEQKPSAGYYLDQAIDQLSVGDRVLLRRIAAQAFDRNAALQADVIIVDHPGRMDSRVIKELATMMMRGKGMVYVVSELADGVNLSGLQNQIGAGLQMPVTFVAPARGRVRRDLSVVEVSRREAPFAVFGDAIDLALAPLRIGGGLGTEISNEALQDRVLATLSDQSVWLTLTDCGAGKLSVLNMDLEQSNVAVSPVFLPLIAELTNAVLPASGSISESVCGRACVRLLPPDLAIADEVIAKPSAEWPEVAAGYGSWEATGTGVIWNWLMPDMPGVYQATLGSKIVDMVAITTPASESDLASLDAGVFQTAGKSELKLGFRDARDDDDAKDRLWNWLLVACVVGLIGEVCTLRVFKT